MPEFFLNNGKIGSLQPQSGSTIKADDEFLKKYGSEKMQELLSLAKEERRGLFR